jgi:hypothetical protein
MDNQYKGMTVNERLYASGLMDEFDLAVKNKNLDKVILILKEVEITESSLVSPILERLGLVKKL